MCVRMHMYVHLSLFIFQCWHSKTKLASYGSVVEHYEFLPAYAETLGCVECVCPDNSVEIVNQNDSSTDLS